MKKNNLLRSISVLLGFAALASLTPPAHSEVLSKVSSTPAADGQLNAPSEALQQRLLNDSMYILFKGAPLPFPANETLAQTKRRFRQYISASKKCADYLVPLCRSNEENIPNDRYQQDLSSAQKTQEWVDGKEGYKSFRYQPVSNRMGKLDKSWIDKNFNLSLDGDNSGWCVWTVRFLLRGYGIKGDNIVSDYGRSVIESGGKVVYGNAPDGVWSGGKVLPASTAPQFIAQPGDLYLYYGVDSNWQVTKAQARHEQATIANIVTLKDRKSRTFDHMAMAIAATTNPVMPYRLEGNRGGRSDYTASVKPQTTPKTGKGQGYLRVRTEDTYYKYYVVIRPNWK
jgi:hypothetical protein